VYAIKHAKPVRMSIGRQPAHHKVTCDRVGVNLVIAASARKHCVSDEDIRHA
jgi:hypothetical protein